MPRCPRAACAVLALLALSGTAAAEGHGPMFGLATPTLGTGQWSSDTSAMILRTDMGKRTMFREMLGYGLNEDLQLALSFPLGDTGDNLGRPPRTRLGTMMAAYREVEAMVLWRFHRQAPDVGKRRESTLLLGAALPTEEHRGGVEVGPAFNAAAVTGYASRTVYWWLGAGWQRYLEENEDRLGDLAYASAVFGYRPPVFRGDYPKPDWRIFLEALAEHAEPDRIGGREDPDIGGDKLLMGPSMLGLFGRWGVEAGVLFPLVQNLKGRQVEEEYRAKAVLTYWF